MTHRFSRHGLALAFVGRHGGVIAFAPRHLRDMFPFVVRTK